ncbi:MAG TPA: hypothetical protein VFW28_17305 [Micropepsaceae bacterium]|nr:hypothetical protein [Micropepsaceae bacterium]
MRMAVAHVTVCTLALTLPALAAPSVPDFSGLWWHTSLPGPEPLASGPTSVTNLSRTREGYSDYGQLVGNYRNPILKPETAATVKKFGDMSLAGIEFPNPANQCWPEPGPFIYKNFGLQVLQHGDVITLLYEQDHEVRHVRMNSSHPAPLSPSFYGDSVGHYEGDTLVVDTVGIRADRPFAMVDLYGTPYSSALHMVERFRLIDYEQAKEGLARDAKENYRVAAGTVNRNYRGKYLQVLFTVDDPAVFTTPWSATVTYGRGSTEWPETVCAENGHVYYDKDETVPTAIKPDF